MEETRGSVRIRELFTKVLTATDISKHHNRLIIPKADAERFFPDVKKVYDSEGKPVKGVRLEFLERNTRRRLDFRYCFWLTSRSYVLTTKWNQFVEEYGLKTKDEIRFFECEEVTGDKRKEYLMIDIVRNDDKEEAMQVNNMQLIEYVAPIALMATGDGGISQRVQEVGNGEQQQGVWLFGVRIG